MIIFESLLLIFEAFKLLERYWKLARAYNQTHHNQV